MKKLLIVWLVLAVLFWGTSMEISAEETPGNLYALSAVLMDGDSGRVLYEKNGGEIRAMASTTKVMTCILALENASGDDYVSVSSTAAAQPDVQLGIEAGEQYYMEDMLYALMLASNNDVAVAIAETIGGSIGGFADMMNAKAKELGCVNTHFVTPNGLDAEDAEGTHRTTAVELAKIMQYAIKNEMFCSIMQKKSHTFSDIKKTKQYTVYNTNALLDMTDGVIAGKTGFTGDAGYCYVCAVEKEGKTFVIALLGCGWPGNKTYKWKDTMALLEYGESNFKLEEIWKEPELLSVKVENAIDEKNGLKGKVSLNGKYEVTEEIKTKKVLIKNSEAVKCSVSMPNEVKAPVRKNSPLGEITFSLNGVELLKIPVKAEKNVEEFTINCCIEKVFHDYFG